MRKIITNRFFDPIVPVRFDRQGADYTKLGYATHLLDSIGDLLPHNSYIIDYYKKNFFYISEESIFLCGYSKEEVMEWGYDFYQKIIPPDDLVKLLEINEAGFDFFYQLDPQKQQEAYISYDLVFIQKDGSEKYVNHKLKAFLFGPDGNLWMGVCCIRPSINKCLGNVRMSFKKSDDRYDYSFKDKKWHKLPAFHLTDNEKHILNETDKGTVEKQIADQLNCTRSNIRYYKSQIMKKTGASNMREAILFLTSNGIM